MIGWGMEDEYVEYDDFARSELRATIVLATG